MRNNVIVLLTCALLAACHQSDIQARYQGLNSDCRSWAEDRQDELGKNYTKASARNAELVTLFSDCMAKKGWQVATPAREAAPGGAAAAAAKKPEEPKKEENKEAVAPPPPAPPAQTAAGPPASEATAAPANISPQPAAANPVASSGAAPPIPGRYYPAEQFK